MSALYKVTFWIALGVASLLAPLALSILVASEPEGDKLFRRPRLMAQHCCAPVQVQAQVVHQPVYQAPYEVRTLQNLVVVPLQVDTYYTYPAPLTVPAQSLYYSVTEAYQHQVVQKRLIREAIREELRMHMLEAEPKGKIAPMDPPAPMPVTKTPLGPDASTPVELQREVLAAYQAGGCVRCHGPDSKGKGSEFKLVLAAPDGKLSLARQNADKRWKIYAMASVGAMPPEAANDAALALDAKHLPALLRFANLREAP
jgi:mono/diheme cytochrome c family protein